ncbi:hypothetical protein VSH64_39545 [Amycolatopsis rhabdoformis]|uniref:Serine/threonine protein kinase n=1 Tax=Amycolatopsis rhabdoformis TaxID=1448059 RepID=A0ABZ1I393_9PSEU|nr:hypothetical protein [Amycolatopsis rhabdoformis]WSE28861.1 hypothetical protein VSH64_39545 [Amycolatopsis rhabdoformis]
MKGPLVDEEVSVADLLVREGWGERLPPPSRSRWRMVAVMAAVVVGCGAAAILVSFGTTANDEATGLTEMKVIEMPDRTDGAGGVSESSPPPAVIEGQSQDSDSDSSGGDETTEVSSPKITSIIDPLNPRGGGEPGTTTSSDSGTATSGSDTSTAPTGTDPGSGGGSANQPPPASPTHSQAPPSSRPCLLGILCI